MHSMRVRARACMLACVPVRMCPCVRARDCVCVWVCTVQFPGCYRSSTALLMSQMLTPT